MTRRARDAAAIESGNDAAAPGEDPTANSGPNSSPLRDGDISPADEERYRLAAIVESSVDAIVSKTLDGIVTSWNAGAEKLFGYTADEIVGRPISWIMPPDRKNDMFEILDKIRQGGRVEHFESVRLSKSGRRIPVSLSVSPIRDDTGRIIGAAKIARDITEQKQNQAERERLYNEAVEAARVRDEFLSVAGHELRTPLTSLQFQLHTVERRLATGQPEKAIEVLQRAREQLQRLTGLTEDLLDVTQITSGRMKLDLEEVDLAGIAREVAERHRESATRAGSSLSLEAREPVTGRWDRSRVEQVVTNLVSNAIKFGNGKPISVRVEPGPAEARLTVADQGIGISHEDQSKIFERFERAVSNRSYGGMGLGLWITRQIVDAHGGRIAVASKPGKGSTFEVELPRDAARATAR